MSREEGADRAAEKRSTHYKDVISRLSYITKREAIIILIISVESDFKAPFLINVRVGRRKERLTVSALLDTGYQLSAVIDY